MVPWRVYDQIRTHDNGLTYVDVSQIEQLDWTFKGAFKTFINNIDIETLRKHHGECFKVIKGVKFDKVVNGWEIFPVIGHWKDVKQEQDKLKDDKSSDYNPALREYSKLVQNSLSGKVI